ncbi:Response regulator receiver domain-containing protein [Devosia enhydra]|uniref:Response regulator receiver domain-containing protein n=1 Tax=Devosia enhydra TaxID=665118 RepID=A0A1K2HV17_9HYPH|nr:response regulator [Devosia enhydra]SFZ82456.1 Response regulator receiver domain-containing protein [Devosia enhydra]
MTSVLHGRRILIVEDDVLLALELEDMLQEAGCEVVGPVAQLKTALDVIDANPLDAALMDLNLRGELSYPAIDALRQRGVPVIVASGYAELPSVRQKLDGMPLLGKPYDLERIRATLEGMLVPADA